VLHSAAAVAQDLRLEREAVAASLGRADHPIHHRHAVGEQVVGEARVLDPQVVWAASPTPVAFFSSEV
jgi:hypothetical protein